MTGLYGRKSLFVKDSLSIEMQMEKGMQLCGKDEIVKKYTDEGFSGKNTKRPAFQELMQDVENGLIDRIIVYRIDRFSRSLLDFSETWEKLSKYGVEFVSVNEHFDTSTPIGKAMLFIVMVFAQLERETVAERVTDNYYERAKLGSWMGGPAPYGFDIGRLQFDNTKNNIMSDQHDKRSKIPTLIENEKLNIVEKLFYEYAENDVISLGMLARQLEEKGIEGIKRKTWNNVTLARMFRNPAYVKADADIYAYYRSLDVEIANTLDEFTGKYGGLLVGKRGASTRQRREIKYAKFSIANWEGRIPSEIFLKVQSKLASNEQLKNNGKGKHTWLTGVIKCGYCGRAMVVAIDPDNKTIRRFKCSGRVDHICDHLTSLHLDDVEDSVQEEIIKVLSICHEEPVVEHKQVSNQEKIELQKIEEQIRNFMNCIGNGQANETMVKYINKEVNRLTKKQQEIFKKMKAPKQEIVKVEKINFKELDFENKKLVTRSLIEKVKVFENDIEIVWAL